MANIFGGVELPAWMDRSYDRGQKLGAELGQFAGTSLAAGLRWATQSENANAVDPATGKQSPISFGQAWKEAQLNQEDPFWQLKQAQLKNSLTAQGVQLKSATLGLEEQTRENSAWMQDAPQITRWITATPEQRQTMPRPTVTSKQGLGIIEKQNQADEMYGWRKQMAENNSLAARMALRAGGDFLKRMDAVKDPAAKSRIGAMSTNKDGTPSAEQWQALDLAEQADKMAAEEQKKRAAEEALKRGDQVTTTITDKGVTTRYAPKKEGAAGPGPLEIETATLPDGSVAWRTKGSKGAARLLANPQQAMKAKAAYDKLHEATIAHRMAIDKDDPPEKVKAIEQWMDRLQKQFDDMFLPGTVKLPSTDAKTATPEPANPKDPIGLGL